MINPDKKENKNINGSCQNQRDYIKFGKRSKDLIKKKKN